MADTLERLSRWSHKERLSQESPSFDNTKCWREMGRKENTNFLLVDLYIDVTTPEGNVAISKDMFKCLSL